MKTKFAKLSSLVLQDLRNNKQESIFFSTYTKQQIVSWLQSPSVNQTKLREVSNFLYLTSGTYRQIVDYYAKMPTLSHIIVPYNIGDKINKKKYTSDYYSIVNLLNSLNITNELPKIFDVLFMEDVFYGYIYGDENSKFIKKLNPQYCAISSLEDGVFNFDFDFSYFNQRKEQLESYGKEFVSKYKKFEKDSKLKWQELDPERTICLKLNDNILAPVPPFACILESLFDIQDYKALAKSRQSIKNYKILSFKMETDKDNAELTMDKDLRDSFIKEVNSSLPDEIGAIVTPWPVTEHSFERNATDSDITADAIKQFYNESGVSQLNFNSEKASSSALLQSIKNNEAIIFSILRKIEKWMNRYIKYNEGKYKFKVQFLNITHHNQADMFKMFKEAATLGVPCKQALAACLGYNPSDTLAMGQLEDILDLRETTFNKPLLSSNTLSSDDAGRPTSEEPLQETGEQTKENDSNLDRV